jgi:HK97 family phage major capsid protein
MLYPCAAAARDVLPDLARATDIAAKAAAENRKLTRDERAVYDDAMTKAAPVLQGLRSQRNDNAVMAYARREFDAIGGPGNGAKSGQRLSFKNMAGGIGNRMMTGDLGQKALAPSGATVIAQSFTDDPVALGRVLNGLLDVLPVTVQATAEYGFLRQSVRTNNAAVTADGAVKPTSVVSLVRVEQSLSVIAHLSEGIPRYWVTDNSALEQFVNSELEFGLLRAVEAKVVADVNATTMRGISAPP